MRQNPPSLETGQNRRFRKLDKIANSKVGQNPRFCKKENKLPSKLFLIKASWPNYRLLAIILPITNGN